MPISVPCPHCHKKWKLKDEYAGKRIKCPNPECAQIISIPAAPSSNGDLIAAPVAPPQAKPKPPEPKPVEKSREETQAEAERLAAAMLNEEPEKKDTATEEVKTFEYACQFCDHKWLLPVSQQGKNVLCPECKARQKIPEKKEVKIDWRDPNAQRPSLARGPELPDDLKDQQTKTVNIDSLVQAGAIPEAEVEPLPLGTKLKRGFIVLVAVCLIGLGIFSIFRGRTERGDNKLYEAAVASIQDVKDDGGFALRQAALFRAAYNTAAGEATIRLNDKTKVKESLGLFSKARQQLEESPKSYERDYLLGELAVAILRLGGTPEQVIGEIRLPWKPELQMGNKPRFNGNGNDVQAELRRVLLALKAEGKAAEFDFRLSVIRRVSRVLIAKEQLETLNEILSQGFHEPEMIEAKAHVAYERMRMGAAPNQAAQPGDDFNPSLDKRYQNITGPDAPALAKRSGTPEQRLIALALVAEFSDDPKPALAAALEIAKREKATFGKGISPMVLIRLSYTAGKAGEKGFAELLFDSNVQALAEAESIRGRAASPNPKIDVAALPKPPVTQAVVGHACAALYGCRQNALAARDKKAAKEYEGWNAGTFRPAGLLGLVLGLQDSQEK